jgi:hypothetical protein
VTEKPKKTVVVPEDFEARDEPVEPMVAFIGWDDEGADDRDASQPVGQDAQGNPVYAPRGLRFRL